MKYIKEQLFPTEVYIADDVLEEEYVDSMKEDILLSQQNKDKDNWQSDPKLHTKKKYKALTDKIIEVSKLVFKDKEYIYDTFQITDMWSNVLKPGEAHRPHTHSNNILSGVYYVEAEQTSGIIFTDPRPQAGVIQPDVTKQFVDNASVIKYDSATNRMILFPSWLQHYVPINETKSNRISIAFNIMLKGKVGSSEEYQSAEF